MYYIAYGSNINQEQMNNICKFNRYIENLFMEDYKFELDSSGYATITKKKDSFLQAAVYEISKEDEENLDKYMGVNTGCYRKEYKREYLMMIDKTVKCLVYISNRALRTTEPINTDYINTIIEGMEGKYFMKEYMNEIKNIK